MTPLDDVVSASGAVAGSPRRLDKVGHIADLLRRVDRSDLAVVASWLTGELRQRRTGIGWSTVRSLPEPAPLPSLQVAEVDAAFDDAAVMAGTGAATRRAQLVAALFARATAAEQSFLRRLVTGELRQGALDGVMVEAVARAAGLPVTAVRRAAMLTGSVPRVARLALTDGGDALAALGLQVGRGLLPMLASTAGSAAAAVESLAADGAAVVVDDKLDGIRVQVHRLGDDVRVFSRSLDDITARVPDIVATVRRLPVTAVVLDGEAIGLRTDGRPRAFQDTGARAARRGERPSGEGDGLVLRAFDLLHLDGTDLLAQPLRVRDEALRAVVPAEMLVVRSVVTTAADAEAAFAAALGRGHEGVVVKAPGSAYDAGRRGGAWLKVKPVHTLDLLVVGVEWGSGRRTGWLSNLHLAARGPDGAPVMVGKTFKGLTDELLRWQTAALLHLERARHGRVVEVRPELVVEVAIDGVQRSTRYPGGAALRFARVVRYREDKAASDADTIGTVRSFLPVDDASADIDEGPTLPA